MTAIGILHHTKHGDFLEVPVPHNRYEHLCRGCAADAAPDRLACAELPECQSRSIFIRNTDEAVAEYVMRRMNGGDLS